MSSTFVVLYIERIGRLVPRHQRESFQLQRVMRTTPLAEAHLEASAHAGLEVLGPFSSPALKCRQWHTHDPSLLLRVAPIQSRANMDG